MNQVLDAVQIKGDAWKLLNAKVNEDSKTKGNKVCKRNYIVKIAKSEKFVCHNSKLAYLTQRQGLKW